MLQTISPNSKQYYKAEKFFHKVSDRWKASNLLIWI